MLPEKQIEQDFKRLGVYLVVMILVVIAALLLSRQIDPSSAAPSCPPDARTICPALYATPDRYWVGSMKEGIEGWVSYGAIFVDKDSQIWIAPDWAVTRDRGPWNDQQLHIKREGEYIILFADSIGSIRWTPGVDSGWGVDKKPGLLAVKLR